jgi:hypothetical protein
VAGAWEAAEQAGALRPHDEVWQPFSGNGERQEAQVLQAAVQSAAAGAVSNSCTGNVGLTSGQGPLC